MFLRHRVRLSRGLIQFALLDLVRQRSEGRKRGKGESVPDWCWKFSIVEVAREWGCSDRELRADLADAEKRGLLESKRIGNEVECRLLLEDWPKLPDYRRGPRLVTAEDQPPEDEPETEEERKKAASAPVHRKIAAVRAGADVKPAKLDRFVDEVTPRWDGPGEVKLELAWENQGNRRRLTVLGSLTPSSINEFRQTSGSAVPITGFPGGSRIPGSGDLLADLIRVQTGLVVDGPGCRRIEKALNGSIPLPFYLEELAAAVESVQNPRPGLAIHLAECQIREKWRLSQKAGPAAAQPKPKLSKFEQAMAAARELEKSERPKV